MVIGAMSVKIQQVDTLHVTSALYIKVDNLDIKSTLVDILDLKGRHSINIRCGVATVSRILTIRGLFCRTWSVL